MARIRTILKPHKEGDNVTLSEARTVFRQLNLGAPANRPFVDDSLLKQIQKANGGSEKKLIKTKSRLSTVIAEMVGFTIAIRDGQDFVPVQITESMIGRKLGELASRARTQSFGSAATRSSSKAR